MSLMLDILTADAKWLEWSARQFRAAIAQGPTLLKLILYNELAAGFDTRADLDHWLRPALVKRLPSPHEAGFRASRAFLEYRKAGGTRISPLPDFFIGAHAEHAGFTLVTRDVGRHKLTFPSCN